MLGANTFDTITQSDTVDETRPATAMKGLLVAAAGDIEMVDKDGNVVLFTIAAGAAPVFIPVQVKRVNATNTTIADASILGIWS